MLCQMSMISQNKIISAFWLRHLIDSTDLQSIPTKGGKMNYKHSQMLKLNFFNF